MIFFFFLNFCLWVIKANLLILLTQFSFVFSATHMLASIIEAQNKWISQ